MGTEALRADEKEPLPQKMASQMMMHTIHEEGSLCALSLCVRVDVRFIIQINSVKNAPDGQ